MRNHAGAVELSVVQPPYLILAAILLSLLLLQINQRAASPVISILDRRLRWLVFAFGAAQICRDFALIDRPYWVLAAVFFIVWFLGGMLYNWLAISALSVSPLPLFPRYVPNQSGGEWPVQPRLLKIREWLRAQGFSQAQALKVEVGSGLYLRVSVYQDAAALVRVELTFPAAVQWRHRRLHDAHLARRRRPALHHGQPLHQPLPGFYPESWLVERRPWCRSLPRLLALHRARLARAGVHPVPFLVDPLADLNATQHEELDLINTELGFLGIRTTSAMDFGKITQEGRVPRVEGDLRCSTISGAARDISSRRSAGGRAGRDLAGMRGGGDAMHPDW